MMEADIDEDVLEPACGEENPGRPGNYCVEIEDHWAFDNGGTSHRDGEDREWRGRDL